MIATIPAKERELAAPVIDLFSRRDYFVQPEVPFGLKRIDLLFRNRSDLAEVVAVELKLRNWRRAAWQAAQNRQIAMYSYIALPSAVLSCISKGILTALGLGLIGVDGSIARVELAAPKSPYVNRRIIRDIFKTFELEADVR